MVATRRGKKNKWKRGKGGGGRDICRICKHKGIKTDVRTPRTPTLRLFLLFLLPPSTVGGEYGGEYREEGSKQTYKKMAKKNIVEFGCE